MKRHNTYDVAGYIMATDAQAMLDHIQQEKWPKVWRRSNDLVYSGEHMLTVKEKIIRTKFPGICHWQVNLARKVSISLEEHVLGEVRPEIRNNLDEVCERIDNEISRNLGMEQNQLSIDELYYQATVSFHWRWSFQDDLSPETESNVVSISTKMVQNEQEGQLRVLRKVFGFAMDLSPAAFFENNAVAKR